MSLSKLKDPEAVLAALREFDHLGRTAFLAKYKFGKSREYMLRDERTVNLYDSKAIVAAAYGHAFPDEGPLRWDNFSGGEATVERKLNDLGFEVVRIGEDWSAEEVDLAVADYFGMLSDEARGAAVNKSAHNERLRLQLKVRSKSSIELKHQNISAVLDDLGLPYIRGYKPRGNLQGLLRTTVHAYIDRYRSELGRVVDDFEERTEPGEAEYRTVVVAPPAVDAPSPNLPRPRLPRKFDFAGRDQRNRKLGHSGERWAFGYERFRVGDEGRSDLVECIRWCRSRTATEPVMTYFLSSMMPRSGTSRSKRQTVGP